MLNVGPWRLETLNGGRFRLDAGVMYGIVPKTVWEKVTPADELNRIPFAIHCVLARNGSQSVLIDTGYGQKMSPLERSSHAAEGGDPIIESLAEVGVSPAEIDAVVFTHLHWDHVEGATRRADDGRLVTTFPNAVHYVHRLEWEDATSGAPELGGSYSGESLKILDAAGQLVLVDDEAEVAPGLWTRLTGGHTRGHQAVVFDGGGTMAIYPGDLCPVITHMRRMWCAAYDLYPLETRRRKAELLGSAADNRWWVLWDHDPDFAVSRVERHRTREFIATDSRASL